MPRRSGALFAMLALLPACGRLGFDDLAAPAPSTEIVAVAPLWKHGDGGAIKVELTAPLGDEVIAIGDGVCVDPVVVSGTTYACTAPPQAPASVEVATVSPGGGRAVFARRFTYMARGGYQLGGPSDDKTSGVAIDRDGNIYVSGGTTGDLDGPNAGLDDAVLAKLDPSGALVWIRQLGTPQFDYARDVAVDPSGDVTIVGYSAGDLDGDGRVAGNDIFVARYAPDGTLRWVTQTGSAGDDQAWDLAVDASGGAVVAVRTTGDLGGTNAGGFDYGVLRYTPQGTVEWMRQAGTTVDDIGHSIAVTPDGVAYLVGYTDGVVEPGGTSAGGRDLFVARYERDGTPGWVRQRGSAGTDEAHDATVGAGDDVWIAGQTTGALDGNPTFGGDDVFVMRMSAAGAHAFTRVRGSPASQTTFGVAVSAAGEAYLSCATGGAFDGQPYAGGSTDVCLIKVDAAGTHVWTRITGTADSDATSSCALDAAYSGLVYVSLITTGSVDGQGTRGLQDMAILKLDASGALQ